jgi:hypothetical protein
LDIATLVVYYDTVVLATVTGYGAPFWNTPDRREPSNEQFRRGDFAIQTPVEVSHQMLISGHANPAQIVVPQLGRIGCVEFDPVTDVPEVGHQYVMFLSADSAVWVVWPVTNGIAQSGEDGPILVTDIARRLDAAAATPMPTR